MSHARAHNYNNDAIIILYKRTRAHVCGDVPKRASHFAELSTEVVLFCFPSRSYFVFLRNFFQNASLLSSPHGAGSSDLSNPTGREGEISLFVCVVCVFVEVWRALKRKQNVCVARPRFVRFRRCRRGRVGGIIISSYRMHIILLYYNYYTRLYDTIRCRFQTSRLIVAIL